MKLGFDAKRIFHNSTGLGNYGRDLIRILANYYPENSYYLYNPKPPSIHRITETKNIHIQEPTGPWKLLSSYWRTGPVRKQIYNDKIDLYHGLTAELPRKPRVPTVVTIHDLIFLTHPELYKAINRKIYYEKTKRAVSSADHIISISQQTKSDISNYFDTDPGKISVIHQGCHPQFKLKKDTEEIERVRKKFHLPENYILNVGTLEERKNALLILKALKQVDYSLVLVGRSTPYVDTLKNYISDHDMNSRVQIIHDAEFADLPAIYQMAKLFCYPSHYEGFGIPILEALHSEIPVITSKSGCFEEAGGAAASYIDPNDSSSLEGEIRRILSDSTLSQAQKALTKEHLSAFEDKIIAEKYMSVYQTVLKHG